MAEERVGVDIYETYKEALELLERYETRENVDVYRQKKGEFLWQESRGRPQGELDYFDCPFSNDVELEDFSKEFLLKLMNLWMKSFQTMAMSWIAEVSKKFGSRAAWEMVPDVWENLGRACAPMYIPLLGPNYKTVDDIKTLQDAMRVGLLAPDGALDKTLYAGRTLWTSPDRFLTIVTHCVMMEYFEGINDVEACLQVCHIAEPRGAEAGFIHPNLKVTGIKVPPRKSGDPNEPFCIWEYRLMDEPQPRGPGRVE